jgi:hypothetical protein
LIYTLPIKDRGFWKISLRVRALLENKSVFEADNVNIDWTLISPQILKLRP